MKRGEVWWAELDPPARRRLVVLVSRDEAYRIREWVTVAPVSTRIRGIRAEVELGPTDGLPHRCAVNLDSLITIRKARLRKRIVQLSTEKIRAVNDAIKFALNLP
ncbi:MAG: type II toxin-antitoxin system PemK/MazF family toxin [Candidatus Bipolaricaulota bacterium]|nr:type II toxin-antitoxin system PemK/MazF family toxin [Candidatus Bipolaricaulota bacterium]